jgi:hypothetical protein
MCNFQVHVYNSLRGNTDVIALSWTFMFEKMFNFEKEINQLIKTWKFLADDNK